MRLIPFRRRQTAAITPAQQRAFSLSDLSRYGYKTSPAGTTGEKELKGVPALGRAVRLRSEAVAGLRLRCYSGDGANKRPRPNVWQSKLFAGPANECQSRFDFWDTVEESLAYRGNAFVWKNVDPLSGQVVDWYALHPDQVAWRNGAFNVTVGGGFIDPVGKGQGKYQVGDDTILHIRGHGEGGTQFAPSPIAIYAGALAGAVGRQKHEARVWRRGTSFQLGIKFPPGISRAQADEWRELWQASYEGTDGDTTAVIGGGAEFEKIGMSQADAQFVAMADLTVLDASLIMGVPVTLLRPVAEYRPDVEQELALWLRFGLAPELDRIEAALLADDQLFGNAQTYPHFDTDAFVRGNLKTEAEILVSLVQAGIITPNEARSLRGLDDLGPAGDIPQITPVGGAPNPNIPPEGQDPTASATSQE